MMILHQYHQIFHVVVILNHQNQRQRRQQQQHFHQKIHVIMKLIRWMKKYVRRLSTGCHLYSANCGLPILRRLCVTGFPCYRLLWDFCLSSGRFPDEFEGNLYGFFFPFYMCLCACDSAKDGLSLEYYKWNAMILDLL